jgi:hypothetical protein
MDVEMLGLEDAEVEIPVLDLVLAELGPGLGSRDEQDHEREEAAEIMMGAGRG